MFVFFFNFYPIIKFMNYNRQYELILNTGIALFLGALALKLELVKFFFSFLFFVPYLIMLPSGPSDSAFTQRGPKARAKNYTFCFKKDDILLLFFIFRVICYHAPFGAQRLSLYTTRGEAPSFKDYAILLGQ